MRIISRRTRRRIVAAVIAGLTFGLAGCGTRAVDLQVTGAQPVTGFGTLHRACDGPTLIYFTRTHGTDDEYEWFYPGGCAPADLDGDPATDNPPDAVVPWVFNDAPPAWSLPNGDSTDDD